MEFIFQSIDVDRIVMEHYQATNTPRGSAFHNISTPLGNKCTFNGVDETNLPQELSELCNHQCKVGQVLIKSPSLFCTWDLFQHVISLLPFAASFFPRGNGSFEGDEG